VAHVGVHAPPADRARSMGWSGCPPRGRNLTVETTRGAAQTADPFFQGGSRLRPALLHALAAPVEEGVEVRFTLESLR